MVAAHDSFVPPAPFSIQALAQTLAYLAVMSGGQSSLPPAPGSQTSFPPPSGTARANTGRQGPTAAQALRALLGHTHYAITPALAALRASELARLHDLVGSTVFSLIVNTAPPAPSGPAPANDAPSRARPPSPCRTATSRATRCRPCLRGDPSVVRGHQMPSPSALVRQRLIGVISRWYRALVGISAWGAGRWQRALVEIWRDRGRNAKEHIYIYALILRDWVCAGGKC